MKRNQMIALLLTLAMAIGLLAGCGQSKQNETPAPAQTEAPAQPAATEAPKAAEAPKPSETAAPTPEPAPETHVITDVTGREVEVPVHPQRVALAATVLPNMVYALQGNLDNIVSTTPNAYKGWEKSMLKYMAPGFANVDTTMCNDDFSVNVEALAQADVDLVLNWDSQADQAEQLAALGIPCVLVKSASNMDTLKALLTLVGQALGCEDRADQALQWYADTEAYFESKADQVAALSEEDMPRVIHFRKAKQLEVYGKGMNPWVTKLAGGNCYLLPAEISAPTMEDVIAFDPEIIFLSNFDDLTPADIYANNVEGQDWSGVSAVKNHRVYTVPVGLYLWAPPNSFEKPFYMRWMASVIQPDIFPEIDIRTELKEFYHDFYNFDLTDAQLDELMRVADNQNSK